MAANPGTIRAESIRFVEADGTAAGTWTGTVKIPAGAFLIDCLVYASAVWTATTSATLQVGSSAGTGFDLDGFYAAVDLKATDLTAGQSLALGREGGKSGATFTEGSSSHLLNAWCPDERTMKATVVTVGAPVTTKPGDTTVQFLYTYASPSKAAWVAT